MLFSKRKADVVVVLTNYKRPNNIPLILDAFDTSTLSPSKIVIVDNHQELQYKLPDFKNHVHDVFRFKKNMGPACRFVGAMGDYDEQYVLFMDDDLLPDVNFLEELMQDANRCQFSTLGVVGRDIVDGYYVLRDIERNNFPQKVDITCRCHLVKRDNLPYAFMFRNEIREKVIEGEQKNLLQDEDDLVMCCGIQKYTGLSSYIGSKNCIFTNLSAPHARAARKIHRSIRQRFIDEATKRSWKSLRNR